MDKKEFADALSEKYLELGGLWVRALELYGGLNPVVSKLGKAGHHLKEAMHSARAEHENRLLENSTEKQD